MRQKGSLSRRRPAPTSTPYDPGASLRQVGLIESGTGFMHGPLAIVAALVAALSLAGLRAWWRANTRSDRD